MVFLSPSRLFRLMVIMERSIVASRIDVCTKIVDLFQEGNRKRSRFVFIRGYRERTRILSTKSVEVDVNNGCKCGSDDDDSKNPFAKF